MSEGIDGGRQWDGRDGRRDGTTGTQITEGGGGGGKRGTVERLEVDKGIRDSSARGRKRAGRRARRQLKANEGKLRKTDENLVERRTRVKNKRKSREPPVKT